jgi:hypothetical protein
MPQSLGHSQEACSPGHAWRQVLNCYRPSRANSDKSCRGLTLHVSGGWAQYSKHGRNEGRHLCLFDEAFYLRSYALAVTELQEGRAASLIDHYVLFGRGRGYLPHPAAARPINAAGGLWIDAADAIDRVQGRHATGQISDVQAERLERFVRDGYVILNAAVPDAVLKAALADFDKAFRGGMPDLRFTCPGVVKEAAPWMPEMLPQPVRAVDIHYMSKPIRQMIFTSEICEFLALIFESRAFATQTLGFLRGSESRVHQDTSYVPYTCATSFAASWIALEDVAEGGGELLLPRQPPVARFLL